ncbi:sigma factor-like helix-turn-helix DNA-binding protein [Microbacterium sp. NPDC056044]|uniref:sigma factor-like helix-turn-helix DNA-binding protein n=1 Tax=Microbacterium sp. NPDC056044 TaxID=3345690 RepID=UPI0035D55B92
MLSSGVEAPPPSTSKTDDDDAAPLALEDEWCALEVFLSQRARLLRIACGITRDFARAEDCVQEAWLRWQLADRSGIENAPAFLATTVTHIAINLIQTARHRHETPSDSLPDTLVDDSHDPAVQAEQGVVAAEVLSVLMARLSPAQLTAYVLRKGFDYAYADIARLLRTSVPNARQLIRRAQAHIVGPRDRPVVASAPRQLVEAFLLAARAGDFSRLEDLLTKGVSHAG